MRREILVPKLGLTMTEGVLVEWMVRPGESFKAGQGLFVIESEKAANEVGAEADGVMLEIVAEAGATLPCGTVIGYWDDGRAQSGASVPATVTAAAPAATPAAAAVVAQVAVSSAVAAAGAPRIPVTPLARRVAAQLGVDVARVTGHGPRGRVRAQDVREHAAAAPPSAPVPAVAATAAAAVPDGLQPLAGVLSAPTALERTVAARLSSAKQQIPHFYLAREVEVSALIDLRRQLNEAQSRRRLTLNHFILAAVGQALAAMPEVNRVWTDEGILNLTRSDVGMAVDTDKGLLVPVLRDVGCLGLGEVAAQADTLIEQARTGRLRGEQMQGGAITVSNAGMHDVTYMTSIINPGQSMILGVGSIRELFRPDAQGQPRVCREMGLVLSADHRVLDGVTALAFLKRVAQGLAQPLGLLLP